MAWQSDHLIVTVYKYRGGVNSLLDGFHTLENFKRTLFTTPAGWYTDAIRSGQSGMRNVTTQDFRKEEYRFLF